MDSEGSFDEVTAARIVRQIISAIKHLHDRGICHRDLKLENIMLESPTSKEPIVKVIDFGLASYFTENELLQTRTGTPYYMAPEVIEGNYDESCDMWSIGVITYCLLAGYPPFNDDSDAKLYRKIQTCDYEFYDNPWANISKEAKSFITSLITTNRSKRMKPIEALKHPWIVNNIQIPPLDVHILENLKSFKGFTSFQRRTLDVMTSLLAPKDFVKIRNAFYTFDLDFSGTINKDEFKRAFEQTKYEITSEEIDDLFEKVKEDGKD